MISIAIYLVAMVMIGVVYSKKTKNVGDFYLGGRKLGPLVTAMSAEASDMSSYLLMGLPGLALASGVAEVGWTVIGLAIGTYLNWLIVAKKLRNYSEHIGAITIPDFFSRRFKDKSNIIMAIAALMIIIFFVRAASFSARFSALIITLQWLFRQLSLSATPRSADLMPHQLPTLFSQLL